MYLCEIFKEFVNKCTKANHCSSDSLVDTLSPQVKKTLKDLSDILGFSNHLFLNSEVLDNDKHIVGEFVSFSLSLCDYNFFSKKLNLFVTLFKNGIYCCLSFMSLLKNLVSR